MTVAARAAAPAAPAAGGLLRAAVGALGSLRLAVVLLILLGLLTWLGTLAQVHRSLVDVQREYFESWFVRQQVARFGELALYVPLPGAYPVLVLLFVNLVVGGMVRLRWSLRTAGILITHVGIALLLVAGFVKLHGSWSGALALAEAPVDGAPPGDLVTESATFVSFHDYELALLAEDGEAIVERTVPAAALAGARAGRVTVRAAGLPFAVEVEHWSDHCEALPKGPMFTPATPVVDGVFLRERPRGKPDEQRVPGCYVTVVAAAGERHQGIVLGSEERPRRAARRPFTFTVAGRRYGLDLRRVTWDLPFRVRLDEFRKDDHPGTTMARDFRSFVTVFDGHGGPGQPVQIFMNTPLRRDGYVIYQSSYVPAGLAPDGSPAFFSVLEVARNPSDQWPLYACIVIAIGLLVHFTSRLVRFLDSSTRKVLAA